MCHKRNYVRSSSIVLLTIFSAMLWMRPSLAEDTATQQHPVRIIGSNLFSTCKDGMRVTTVSDGAQFIDGDAILAADTIDLRGRDGESTATSMRPFTFTTPKCTITADAVEVQVKERTALFKGAVQMKLTRQGKDADKKQETLFTSETLSYDYGKRLATFSGNVKMVGGKDNCTFEGTVTVDVTIGAFTCEKITVSPV